MTKKVAIVILIVAVAVAVAVAAIYFSIPANIGQVS